MPRPCKSHRAEAVSGAPRAARFSRDGRAPLRRHPTHRQAPAAASFYATAAETASRALRSQLFALSSAGLNLECEAGPEVDARVSADAMSHHHIDMEKRRRRPEAAAHSLFQFLILQALTLVIHRPRIDEDTAPEFRRTEGRGQRYPDLSRTGQQRISDAVAGPKSPKVARFRRGWT